MAAGPSPVGTIEVHRGRRLDERRVLIDARLVSGDLSRARFIRRQVGKEFWIESRILSVTRRSSDLPDEIEIEVESPTIDGFDEWTDSPSLYDEPFWQLADGPSAPEGELPNEAL